MNHPKAKKLKRAIRRRNRAERRYKQALRLGQVSVASKWRKYQQEAERAGTIYDRELEQANRKWRQRMIEEGTFSNKKFWQTLKPSKIQITAIETPTGDISMEKGTITAFVQEYFKRLGAEEDICRSQEPLPLDAENEDEDLMREILDEEVSTAMRGLQNNKACGEEDIPNELLKHGGKQMVKALTKIFNLFLIAKWTPQEWNHERVILLHKKGNQSDLNNYRGISLTSNIGKLYVRMINARLSQTAEARNWIPEAQAAFRKGRCAEDHLFVLSSLINDTKLSRTPMSVAFVDIRKAYDSVDRTLLWQRLERMGVGHNFLTILKSLYRNTRRHILLPHGKTDWFECYRGLRQGCPLSPLLFALYIAHIPAELDSHCEGVAVGDISITNMMYADDIVLIQRNKSGLLQAIHVLYHELAKLGLHLNFGKSNTMCFGPHPDMSHDCPITTGDGTVLGIIKESNTYKYLGVNISRSQGFRFHMQDKLQSLPSRVGFIQAQGYASQDRYLTLSALWRLSALKGVLYGAEVMQYTKKWRKKVQGAQSKVLKSILGATRSASYSAILGLARWPSVEAEIDVKQIAYWLKLLKMPEYRWPKKMFMYIRNSKSQFQWYKNVHLLLERYQINPTMFMLQSWRKALRHVVEDLHWQEWVQYMQLKTNLPYYDPYFPGPMLVDCSASRDAKLLTLALIGDIYYFARSAEMKYCVRCAKPSVDWVGHIFWECTYPEVQGIRSQLHNLVQTHIPSAAVNVTDWILQMRQVEVTMVAAQMLEVWRVESGS